MRKTLISCWKAVPPRLFCFGRRFSSGFQRGRKCLSLSANPVGEHGFLFGPGLGENQSVYLSHVLGLLKVEGIMFLQEHWEG